MANEAVAIELHTYKNPVQRTIADGSAGSDIEKGTITKLSDPNTVGATVSADIGAIFGGIMAAEKEGGDGSTTIGCHMDGVFDLTVAAGGSCSIGEQVTTSGANTIDAATEAQVQLGGWIGYAEEAGSTAEVIRVRLRGGG